MSARRAGCRTVFALVAVAGLSATMAGCSSSTPSTAGTTPAATGSAAASANATGQGAGTRVTVDEKEYSLTLSRTSFTSGTYTFVATDVGQVAHALAIAGPGVSATRTGPINPGSSANLTVKLEPGSYELWCPIDDHKALGMDTHITVGAPSSSSSTSAVHMVQ